MPLIRWIARSPVFLQVMLVVLQLATQIVRQEQEKRAD